jgi:hypothetical protein
MLCGHLSLRAGELILVGCELLYRVLHGREIKRNGRKLLLDLCSSHGRGSRLAR